MSDDIKISIVVPFYKVEKYFRRCLDSIVNQTLKEIEIILIDDCGGDKSIEIAEEYAQNDSRIKIVRNEKNSGQGYSRNLGIKMAKGEYIAFVDSDDWLESNMYEVLYDKAKEKDADIIKCDFLFHWKTGPAVYDIGKICSDFDKVYTVMDDPIKFLGVQVTAVWNGMYKNAFIQKYRFQFDEINKFEDILFCWQTIIKAEKMLFVKDLLCHYNKLNETSDTNISKYLIKYITNDMEILANEIRNEKKFHSAYILYAYNCFNWIFPMVNIFQKKYVFNKYFKFLDGIDISKISALISGGFATSRIQHFAKGDYSKFNNGTVFTKILKALKYANW